MAEARIPVFCNAQVSAETLNHFFQQANEETHRKCFDYPMSFLMVSTRVPEDVDQHCTAPPVDGNGIEHNPFKDMSTEDLIEWAQKNLGRSGLSKDNMVILDDLTAQDETCILVSLKDLPDDELPDGMDKWIIIRSDFESSIISLMTKETGVGGDDHLDTDYEGSDGVLRNTIKNRERVV
ncbi:Hypothetical predicted protein [Lecanosticta acicola]|uniref:Uncharacterized protein n=1 Tax=Lecanosticta acicola TaxID=111012 RepID=A0AAI8Z7Z7_9PEZI|nr:Hypothetical predicted protein [Lecanosticta acicola]